MRALPANTHSIIGRKQRTTHAEFLRIEESIESLVSRSEIEDLVERTAEDIRRAAKGRVAYAWSGGKDSLALELCCRQAGIKESMIGLCHLEYPAFLGWIDAHAPAGLTKVYTAQDMDWLVSNLHMLFPTPKYAPRWYHIVQNAAQDRYYRDNRLDLMLFGRRIADGNVIGNEGLSSTRDGLRRYCPLMHWRHEDVLAAVHYFEIPVPPIYRWPNGYRVGTGPWPKRRLVTTVEQNWRDVYTIDPSVVEMAAQRILSARTFLDSL